MNNILTRPFKSQCKGNIRMTLYTRYMKRTLGHSWGLTMIRLEINNTRWTTSKGNMTQVVQIAMFGSPKIPLNQGVTALYANVVHMCACIVQRSYQLMRPKCLIMAPTSRVPTFGDPITQEWGVDGASNAWSRFLGGHKFLRATGRFGFCEEEHESS